MHKSNIRNHRGSCEISYGDINKAIEYIEKLSPDLVIFYINIAKINPLLTKKFSFIPNKIYLNSGEKTKTLEGVFSLLNQIDDLNQYPLNHAVVIGGATIQDTCGTALCLLKRGVNWTYLPTTLLAQADSCIGSKTSINSRNTKNLYGLFYSPQHVYIVSDFLKTLPEIEILSGIGDAMHYLLLDINKFSDYILNLIENIKNIGLKRFISESDQALILSSTVHKIKKNYIEIDEFDKSERKVLNLGHSFGHAIEAFFDYKLPHGVAVLYGLVLAIKLSIQLFKKENSENYRNKLVTIKEEILETLDLFSPISNQNIFSSIKKNKEKFLNLLSRDKKNTSIYSYKLVLFKFDSAILVDCSKNQMLGFLNTKL